MNDIISRAAAIETIRRLRGEIHTYPSDGCKKILIDKAEAQTELMLLPTPQKWMPCSERLPEKAGTYLVTIEGVLGVKMSYTEIADYAPDLYRIDPYGFRTLKGCAGFYQYDSEYGFVRRDDVIAWMELPEAYKGD